MRSRSAALLAPLLLLASACGARLSDNERLAGIQALGRGGGGQVINGGQASPGATVGPGATTGGPGATVGPGATSGPGGAPLPPGGNGGATDIGVTANSITLTVASDISGVQPGLFKSTHEAMSAWGAMINSQGGLFGRRVNIQRVDTQARDTENQAAVSDACKDSFALVGSMSAFDGGGATVGESCGIPDVSAITVNARRQLAKNVYPAFPQRPDKLAIGTANYIKKNYPDVLDKAAMVYLNAGVTKANAQQRARGYASVGFKFRFYEVQVLEANYGPIVQRLKDDGIEYVNMVANYQSVQKLLEAMDQANWFPKVRDFDSVVYSPNFPKIGPAAEGTLLFLTTAITEEASSNPEMQLYLQWLSRVAPGSRPDFFGFYAWSAGQLFAKVHKDVGAKITRKNFLAAIKNVHDWTSNGLHVNHDIGNKLISPCFLYLEVRSARFVRKHPSNGFECGMGGLVNT